MLLYHTQTDLEPPIIKPLDANTFDNDALPPGEEEILVPPFIPAADSVNENDENTSDNQTTGTETILSMYPLIFFAFLNFLYVYPFSLQ